jgi:hypothetical protein
VISELVSGTPTPAGFTKLGTTDLHYTDTTGHQRELHVNIYQKN